MKARIIITDECNLDCSYCVMKQEEVYNSFEKIDFKDFLKIARRFDEFILTGGEPCMDPAALIQTFTELKKVNSNANYYLYTNGQLLSPDFLPLLKQMNGVNISIHTPDCIHDNGFQWQVYTISRVTSVRLHIWENWASQEVRNFAMQRGIYLREWKNGDCESRGLEERYRLRF